MQLLGYACGFLGLGGFSSWVLSSVEKKLWDVLGVVSVLTTKHASG
jgi:hypothetical protein